MDRDCGWVELLSIEDDSVQARGRLVVTLASEIDQAEGVATQRGQVVPVDEPWRGRLDPLRPSDDRREVEAGEYRIRFEEGLEVLGVRLGEWLDHEGEGGEASVVSTDGQLPSVIAELGGN